MIFQLSPDVDRDKVFCVNRGELEGRFDPHFYEPTFIKNEKQLQQIGCVKLAHQSLSIFSGITPKSGGDAYCEQNAGIPFVRSGDFLENGKINFSELLYIKPEIHNGLMKGSQIKQNDLLIAIVGATIGKVGIYKDKKEANINQAIAAIRLKPSLKPEFVRAFLLTSIGQKVIDRIKRPVARANLNLEEVASFNIPCFSLSKQNEIIQVMDAAYVTKKQKEAEAQRLLDSIGNYLLGELGVELQEQWENTVKDRIFYRNNRQITGNRIDPYYYKEIFLKLLDSIHNSKYSIKTIGDVSTKIINGYDCRQFVDNGIAYLRVSNIRKDELSLKDIKYIPDIEITKNICIEEGNILLTRKGSYGISTVANKEILESMISSEIFLIKLKDAARTNPQYISIYLNSKIGQLYFSRIKTGAIMGHISQDALQYTPVLLPHIKKQEEIVGHITEIRNQAKQLQQQAKSEIEQAKKEVEAMILGEDESKA